MWNKIIVDLLLFEYGLWERNFSQYDVVHAQHIKSSDQLEGVTISVAIGKGLNPAPLLKMTVFTFMVKKIKR